MSLKINPTADQLQVIDHRTGPGLVLAGAGSGKTSTISVRTIRLLEEGADPRRILKMTFSRKAAGEMRSKMVKLAGSSLLRGLTVDTFHAWCFRLVREFPARFGRTSAVTVADESDQKRLIKECAREAGLEIKESQIKRAVEKARSIYSLAKNCGLQLPRNREEVAELIRFKIGGLEKLHEQLLSMLGRYEDRLRRSNLVDFDDLCLLVGREMDQDRGFAELIGRRYQHLIVDEAQDTNLTQFWIIRALSKFTESQLLIGDQKQAIYGFRGARIENINNFIAEFEPRRYLMRENFRSTAVIVDGANALIAQNRRDLGESFSTSTGGMGYTVLAAPDTYQGIRQIQDHFQKVIRSGVPLAEIAFLVRVKRLSRLAEVALTQIGVPSRIVGGMSIFDSLEGRAAIAAVRLLQNPHDGPALAALGAFHPLLTEGVVTAALDGVANGLDVYSALRNAGKKGGEAAASIEERLDRLRSCGPTQVGHWVSEPWGLDLPGFYKLKAERAKTSNIEEMEKELNRRLENLALIDTATEGAIARVGAERAGRDLDPGEYAAWVPEPEQWTMVVESRLDDREESRTGREAVSVMTVHRAKGLEWEAIFVLGASESILPLTGPDDDDDDGADDGIEEERRLAYVAVTRARSACCLVHIENMGRYVTRNNLLEPSRFLDEMGLKIPIPGIDQSELQREGVYGRRPVAAGAPW